MFISFRPLGISIIIFVNLFPIKIGFNDQVEASK